MMPFDKA